MFKAVLLGQWHSLSDPELEHSLITRFVIPAKAGIQNLGLSDNL
ncbi:transposase [Neisseria meningitidis]|nr:transposase [Neisseria meningitidis]